MRILVAFKVILDKILIAHLDQNFICRYVNFLVVRDDLSKTDFFLCFRYFYLTPLMKTFKV